jgi:hypothetical protein
MCRVVCAAALAFVACKEQAAPTPPVVPTGGYVFALGSLEGTTEPCGCTSDPKGGLDRIAGFIEAQRARGAVALVVTGNTFFSEADPPAHRFEQDRRRAEAVAEVLKRLAPVGIVPGPADLGSQRSFTLDLAKRHGLTLFLGAADQSPRWRPDTVIRDVGGVSVGFVGSSEPDADAYSGASQVLRKHGAKFVVGLISASAADATEFARALKGIDALVAGGSEQPAPVKLLEGTLVAGAMEQGQALGILELSPKGSLDTWAFDDGGRALEALRVRIARLEEAVARLPAGPARDARAGKLRDLRQEASTSDQGRPSGSHVRWGVGAMRAGLPEAAWARDVLKGYNRSLCEITTRATAARTCTAATDPRAEYVGAEACGSCHPDALEFYKGTKHAHAWATLTARGKECDLSCIGCHTLGYEQPGGFCRVADAPKRADVQCENCHGPGAGHVANPFAKSGRGPTFGRGRDAAMCMACHNKEHSDQFEFATYLERILGPGHGNPRVY